MPFPFNLRTFPRRCRSGAACVVIGCFVASVFFGAFTAPTFAQTGESQLNVGEGPDQIEAAPDAGFSLANDPDSETQAKFSLLGLLLKGGVLMVPIVLMSVLVIALVIERLLSLRERKVLPKQLVHELGTLAASSGGFEPKEAYRICQAFPSSASTVIRSMLLKVGRPQSEVERAVSEVSDREASRLYRNVRWLNLVAAVAPLVGLFGTVWGMIQAFFQTTQLTAGQNKSVFLAEGIYVALVTTLGGLAVAIPAAIFSHYFEGRIQNLFFQIDELLFNLMPQIERFEGRLRMNFGIGGGNGEARPVTAKSTADTAPRQGTVPPRTEGVQAEGAQKKKGTTPRETPGSVTPKASAESPIRPTKPRKK